MDKRGRDLAGQLSVDDRMLIGEVLGSMPELAAHVRQLGRLLRGWADLAAAVEAEYDDGIYEYLNDGSCRGILQEALDHLPDGIRERLAAVQRPFDERFWMATVPLEVYLGSGGDASLGIQAPH